MCEQNVRSIQTRKRMKTKYKGINERDIMTFGNAAHKYESVRDEAKPNKRDAQRKKEKLKEKMKI